MVYKWKTEMASLHNVDPQIVGEVLEGLEKTIGLTTQNLVDVSRDEDAPLHKEFEWEDSIAAEKWRCRQASHIINHIIVDYEDSEDTEQEKAEIRAFVTLNKGTGYARFESINTILKDSEKTNSLLEIAKNELFAFQKKYNSLVELSGVFGEIEKLRGGK